MFISFIGTGILPTTGMLFRVRIVVHGDVSEKWRIVDLTGEKAGFSMQQNKQAWKQTDTWTNLFLMK